MNAEWCHSRAKELVRLAGSRDMQRIARELNIKVLYNDNFTNLLGMYFCKWRNRFIFLNSNLDDIWLNMVLAHEIGHACGWHDIYCKNGGSIVAQLREGLRQSWMPLDWSNGTGCRFYDPLLSQYQVIQRLLMFGEGSNVKCDIPSGGVYGRTKSGALGNVGIGSSEFTTASPRSL